MSGERPKALVLHPRDNVATAIRDLGAGELVKVTVGSRSVSVKLEDHIPFRHKFALRDIPTGEAVCKYGEVIGVALRDIKTGEHVHVHNIASPRRSG